MINNEKDIYKNNHFFLTLVRMAVKLMLLNNFFKSSKLALAFWSKSPLVIVVMLIAL